jgi:uncharacterized protein YbjQ (UPF0145 family)
MDAAIEIAIYALLVVVPLLGGLLIGRWTEGRHFKSLDQREAQNAGFLITQVKTFPFATAQTHPTILYGEAAIACDYFKAFAGGLRKLFGGEMKSYQTLLVRARREALQRIVEQARAAGYNAVCNVRYQSADIGGNNTSGNKKGVVMAIVMVTATAYHCQVPAAS